MYYPNDNLKMDIPVIRAAREGDLSVLDDAIRRGDDINSVNEVSLIPCFTL